VKTSHAEMVLYAKIRKMTLTMNFTLVIVNHFTMVWIAILKGTFVWNSSSHVKMEPHARLLIAHIPIHANVNRVILEKTVTKKLTNVKSTGGTHATEVNAKTSSMDTNAIAMGPVSKVIIVSMTSTNVKIILVRMDSVKIPMVDTFVIA